MCRSFLVLSIVWSVGCASSGEVDDSKEGTTTGTTDVGPGDDSSGGDDGGDDGGGDDGGGDDGGTGSADGDLYINEFMASNDTVYPDEGGAYPDWIELYNAGSETVDLGGWTITDDLEEPDKHTLDDSLSIEPGGFLVLFADDDEEEGARHVGFNLSAGGESIGLYRPDGGAIDELDYGEMGTDISMARVPDGSSNWEVTDSPTPETSNGE